MLILANSASPMMFHHLLMLLAGNFFIGALEGFVIGAAFKVKFRWAVPTMIVANYASMWVGALLFGIGESPSPIPDSIFAEPLYRVGWLWWICIATGLILSLAIEWPFCWLLVRLQPSGLKRSLAALLLAQAASYPLMLLVQARGTNTLNREVNVVQSLQGDRLASAGWVYFIDPRSGDVQRMRIDRSSREVVAEAELNDRDYVLAAWREPDQSGEPWQIVASTSKGTQVIVKRVEGSIEAFRQSHEHPGVLWPPQVGGWMLAFSGTADLREPAKRIWTAEPSGNGGLRVQREGMKSFRVAYDTLFTSWWTRSVTILRDDFVVFEFGGQICLLDIDRRELTLLIRGRSPVVVLDPT